MIGNAAGAPHAEVEGEAGQNRNHDVDDFGRQAAQFDNGDGLAVDGNAEEAGEHRGHVVLDGEAAEHEGIARIARDGFDAGLQALVGREFAAQVELADIFLENAGEVGGAIGQRRINADV